MIMIYLESYPFSKIKLNNNNEIRIRNKTLKFQAIDISDEIVENKITINFRHQSNFNLLTFAPTIITVATL